MNQVILIGRLARDPELEYTPNTQTAVCRFTLAVDRAKKNDGENKADFIRCKCFSRQAEALSKFKHKGDEVAIAGRIETGSYPNKNGETVYTTEVICNAVEYTHGSKNNGGAEESEPTKGFGKKFTEPSINSMLDEELPDSFEAAEDELPF